MGLLPDVSVKSLSFHPLYISTRSCLRRPLIDMELTNLHHSRGKQ